MKIASFGEEIKRIFNKSLHKSEALKEQNKKNWLREKRAKNWTNNKKIHKLYATSLNCRISHILCPRLTDTVT